MPQAAGFSLKKDKIDDFYQYLCQNIDKNNLKTVSSLYIDGVLDIHGVNTELLESLKVLEPFGESNPEPCFVITNVMISNSISLKNGHVSCILTGRDGGRLSAIAFRVADKEIGSVLLKNTGKYYHVAGRIKQDIWKGKAKIQMYIEDLAEV